MLNGYIGVLVSFSNEYNFVADLIKTQPVIETKLQMYKSKDYITEYL